MTTAKVGPIVAACLLTSSAFAASFTTFAVPGAWVTNPVSINSCGDIAGVHYTEGGPFHGFLRTNAGTLTTFDVAGATETSVSGINDQGEIAGTWSVQSEGYLGHAFVRSSDGQITTFDPPNAHQTMSACISNNGSIGGLYYPSASNSPLGYIRFPDGSFTTFTGPDGHVIESICPINSTGDMVGTLSDRTLFIRYNNGRFLIRPLASVPAPVHSTYVTGINASRQVVGTLTWQYRYPEFRYGFLPFVWSDYQVTEFLRNTTEGSTVTYALAINDLGDVVGGANIYGFLRTIDGTVTRFLVNDQPTFANAINNAGLIVGTTGISPNVVGFVGRP